MNNWKGNKMVVGKTLSHTDHMNWFYDADNDAEVDVGPLKFYDENSLIEIDLEMKTVILESTKS